MSLVPDSPDFSLSPGEEALVADQAAAQATTPSGHGHGHRAACENCGTPLQGPYCHKCGQHDFDFTRSFWHVLLEALESVFHFDEKIFRNLVSLLFRPGRLSADFNAGKRASQVPPFRLYVFVSFVYFLLTFLHPDEKAEMHEKARTLPEKAAVAHQAVTGQVQTLADNTAHPVAKEQLNAAAEKLRQLNPKAGTASARSEPTTETTPPVAGSDNKLHITLDPGDDTWLGRHLADKIRQALEHQHETLEAFFHAVPKMLLFYLPFFALYTRLLFRGAGQVYLQHLIVSVHYHTFFFLWSLLGRGLVALIGLASTTASTWLDKAVAIWLLVYPVIMLRRLYQESWARTLTKSVALAILSGLTLLLALVATYLAIILLR